VGLNILKQPNNIMNVTSAASYLASSAAGAPSDTVTNNKSNLDQNAFLQLLVAQLQNQNPLNPQSDTQMAAQMAQFSALQQSSEMSSSLAMLQADSLIGNEVTLQVDAKTSASGVVQGVMMQGGKPQILVNGALYNLSQVTSVTQPAPTTPATGTAAN
jgi:flagellar basal-body rod modification protein FlgD